MLQELLLGNGLINYHLWLFCQDFFGAISGFIGTLVSALSPRVATGAVIVVVLSIIALIGILFGRQRGIVWRQIKTK